VPIGVNSEANKLKKCHVYEVFEEFSNKSNQIAKKEKIYLKAKNQKYITKLVDIRLTAFSTILLMKKWARKKIK
jgi:hypothetical protein